ncbi:NAD(+) kinase [Candidatus Methanosphaera massiliense]|jgi:NAD+ kinase|uniref:NAD(+) kinase n=1 Tax=Methanosphaera TaxID=2316 RepID=UPI0023801596|nr:NAD(+) kinase [Candidatus Methanosphaera massiliense]MDD6286109.1 NAD(+) kinase [Methanobacteriaceae archaeon]MDE4077726.1 NAD(+) kinase [Candidatus Methanosphaera massiliense]MDY2745396.1 NAD(+) kinase [Methanosphaera sp.]
MKIGIVSRTDKEEAIELDRNIVKYLLANHVEIELDTSLAKELEEYSDLETPIEDMTSDIVLCVGGDGTVLNAQHVLSPKKIPILSINMGTVGFLTEVDPEDIFECLDKLLSYDFFIEERLQLDVLCDDKWITVLNELVLMTSQPAKMLNLRVSVDEEVVDEVRADGLIVSTPSGSTAYSMSAGGPIVDPRVDAAIIIPICPFKLNTRPKIVPAESTITVKFLKEGKQAIGVLDGVSRENFNYMDEVKIRKSDNAAYFVRFKKNFYNSVNNKLIVG